MKNRMYLGVLVVAGIAMGNIAVVKAIEPVSMIVGALVVTGVSKAIDGIIYLFGPSKSNQDYKDRHARLKLFSKKDFKESVELARETVQQADLEILSQHELYRYEDFIEVIKEMCPDYAAYIKALMHELDDNPKARIVKGFETDHLYHKWAGILKKKAKDFSAFYRLIQKLYVQVLEQEKKLEEQRLQANKDALVASDACHE